jgi:hypothetical protein
VPRLFASIGPTFSIWSWRYFHWTMSSMTSGKKARVPGLELEGLRRGLEHDALVQVVCAGRPRCASAHS